MASLAKSGPLTTTLITSAAMLFVVPVGCGRKDSSTDTTVFESAAARNDSTVDRERAHRHDHALTANYVADCNDPDSYNPACIHPSEAVMADARAKGYKYYVGHAEPTIEFFSTAATSGSNMQWQLKLPATDPTPTQSGSSVANFELTIADWIGLVLCNPNSRPYGSCTAASDSNNPNTAGSAFMELQFYPPGVPAAAGGCSNTQWCVQLVIWSWEDQTTFQTQNCLEPGSSQYLTTNGTPGGPKLLLSTGDSLLVAIYDTTGGLKTDVLDQTSGALGTMVASATNQFVHNTALSANGVCSVTKSRQCSVNSDCPSGETCGCQTEPFTYHPMYATASPGQILTWGASQANVSFAKEIGHWELCGDSNCVTKPDGADDSSHCYTTRGIGGCIDTDTDSDGTPYQPDWPDGSSSHPAPTVIGSPSGTGVGPQCASPANPASYNQGYPTISFQTTSGTAGAFYPFYSQAGNGTACRFDFGNDIPGVTTNDFGKIAQYGTTISNPCYPGLPAWIVAVDALPLL
jgi:hypothetical protein